MLRKILICSGIVLAFDIVASLITKFTGVPYRAFALPEDAMYLIMGAVLQRVAGFGAATMVPVTIAATVEVSLGWWISVAIGVGYRPTSHIDLTLFSAVTAGLLATALGALGMWIGYGLSRASKKSEVA